MEIKKEIIINKSVTEVWDILGNQYGQAYRWASSLNHSEGYGAPQKEGAACNNRSCDTTQGLIKEVIKIYDPNNYILEYEVLEGFPFFVDTGVNNWQLTKISNQQTKVNVHLKIQTKGLVGSVMQPMMKLQMNSLLSTVVNDLKHYVETGEPSPNKAKELQKLAKKRA